MLTDYKHYSCYENKLINDYHLVKSLYIKIYILYIVGSDAMQWGNQNGDKLLWPQVT